MSFPWENHWQRWIWNSVWARSTKYGINKYSGTVRGYVTHTCTGNTTPSVRHLLKNKKKKTIWTKIIIVLSCCFFYLGILISEYKIIFIDAKVFSPLYSTYTLYKSTRSRGWQWCSIIFYYTKCFIFWENFTALI